MLRLISFILLLTINLSAFDDYLFDILEGSCYELIEEQEDESKEENKKNFDEYKIIGDKQTFGLFSILKKAEKVNHFFEVYYPDSTDKSIHTPPPEL